MNRREFMLATGTGAAACLWPRIGFSQPGPDHPNLLFILLDDMNDWIGCLGGHPQGLTPNIDALAGSGVLFTNAHVNSTSCSPSRAALFSGRRPSSTGIYANGDNWWDALDDNQLLPANLASHGYSAHLAGKAYHGSISDAWTTVAQGVSYPYPPGEPLNGLPDAHPFYTHFDWGGLDVSVQRTRDGHFVNHLLGLLEQPPAEPICLLAGLVGTHDPWYPARRYLDLFPLESIQLPVHLENDTSDLPPIVFDLNFIREERHTEVTRQQQWRRAVQHYLAILAQTDDLIGRLLNGLADSPLANDTIVLMTSDHGWHLGQKQHWGKYTLWNEATRVPLIAKVPGVTPAGGVCPHPVELIDLYPTLVDLCGLTPYEHFEGTSLLPQLEQPSLPTNRKAVITARYMNHSVVDNAWRLIRYEDGSDELYNRIDDPYEFNNLAGDPEYDTVIDDLAQWLPETNVLPGSRGGVRG